MPFWLITSFSLVEPTHVYVGHLHNHDLRSPSSAIIMVRHKLKVVGSAFCDDYLLLVIIAARMDTVNDLTELARFPDAV